MGHTQVVEEAEALDGLGTDDHLISTISSPKKRYFQNTIQTINTQILLSSQFWMFSINCQKSGGLYMH